MGEVASPHAASFACLLPSFKTGCALVDPHQLASGALRLVRAMADGLAHEQRFEK